MINPKKDGSKNPQSDQILHTFRYIFSRYPSLFQTFEQRETYLRAIAVDKKMKKGKVGFVVLRDIGRAGVFPVAPAEIIKQGRA